MNRIVRKKELNPTVTLMEIEAPFVAKKAQPGQFIILRVDEEGERIPLTIAGYDREQGTVTIIFQIVGATTEKRYWKERRKSASSAAAQAAPLRCPLRRLCMKWAARSLPSSASAIKTF